MVSYYNLLLHLLHIAIITYKCAPTEEILVNHCDNLINIGKVWHDQFRFTFTGILIQIYTKKKTETASIKKCPKQYADQELEQRFDIKNVS